LRDKTTNKKDLLPIAQALKNLCAEKDVLFIINDNLEYRAGRRSRWITHRAGRPAGKCSAKISAIDMLIGCSVFNAEQAQQAVADGADYVGVGAIYPTPVKMQML